jgi:putative lipoprotein
LTLMSRFSLAATITAALVSGCAVVAGAPSPLAGRWLAEDIRGGGIVDRQTTLEIRDDGSVSGSGGCNRYTSRAAIAETSIRFEPVAASTMACAPATMDQEVHFFAALEEVVGWKVDSRTGHLILTGADGTALIRFADAER